MNNEFGLREQLVNIDGADIFRVALAELFHPVCKAADAVDFRADEVNQRAALFRMDIIGQQLRRAVNTGQRVFNLVGQHPPHGRDGAATGWRRAGLFIFNLKNQPDIISGRK